MRIKLRPAEGESRAMRQQGIAYAVICLLLVAAGVWLYAGSSLFWSDVRTVEGRIAGGRQIETHRPGMSNRVGAQVLVEFQDEAGATHRFYPKTSFQIFVPRPGSSVTVRYRAGDPSRAVACFLVIGLLVTPFVLATAWQSYSAYRAAARYDARAERKATVSRATSVEPSSPRDLEPRTTTEPGKPRGGAVLDLSARVRKRPAAPKATPPD